MNTQPPTRQRKPRIGARPSPQPPKAEFIYHWNRIIGALAALVLLLGLIGFALHAWLSSPSAPMDAGFDETGAPVAHLEAAPESGEKEIGEPVPADRLARTEQALSTGTEQTAQEMPVAEVAEVPEIPPEEGAGPGLAAPDIAESPIVVVQTPPEPARPGVIPAPTSATPPDTAAPAEEAIPARPETHETAEEDWSRVFLPPGTRVNLRAAPSLASPVLRILEADVDGALRLLETGEAFHQVRSAGGIVGWVSRDFSSLTPYAEPVR